MSEFSFKDLRFANARRRVEWHGENVEQWGITDWSNELAGEVGEACNIVKKIRRITTGVSRRGPRTETELSIALLDELADVVICADLLAEHIGGDLGHAVLTKFNETSKKHGLKTRIEL